MRALEFITGHVIFKLRFNQIYQMKTTKSLSLIYLIMEHFVRFLHAWLNSFLSGFLIILHIFFVFICVDYLGDALLPCLHQMKEQIFHLVWVFIGLDLSHEQQKKTFSCLLLQLWQFGLSSFKERDTKLVDFLPKINIFIF